MKEGFGLCPDIGVHSERASVSVYYCSWRSKGNTPAIWERLLGPCWGSVGYKEMDRELIHRER
jgi:hypothetical protein